VKRFALSHLADDALLRDGSAHIARNRWGLADALAHIAEIDARELYLPLGYTSMFAFCRGAWRLSDDVAGKYIHAARTARRFPALFVAVAEGRLELCGVLLLAPRLSPANAEELISAATHKTRVEIEQLLADRFPRPDVETRVRPLPAPPLALAEAEHAPGHVGEGPGAGQRQYAPGHVGARGRVSPLAPEAYALQCNLDREEYDALRCAQDLLGAQAAYRDLGRIVGRGLKLLAAELEKQKFAATARPRRGHKAARRDTRYIPAHVKRAVWEREQGRCAFVSESGHRCEARSGLEFDHKLEFARGGEATVEGIELLCRAHNQFKAERTFGAGFMSRKREEARRARAAAKARRAEVVVAHDGRSRTAAAQTEAEHAPGHVESAIRQESESSEDRDVVPWLRGLGYSAAQARRAAESIECDPDASLEQRLRLALKALLPPHRTFDFRRGVAT
jgi:hypothetical protein